MYVRLQLWNGKNGKVDTSSKTRLHILEYNCKAMSDCRRLVVGHEIEPPTSSLFIDKDNSFPEKSLHNEQPWTSTDVVPGSFGDLVDVCIPRRSGKTFTVKFR